MNQNKKNNGMFLLIILIVGIVLVFLFPKIHELTSHITLPEVEKSKEQNTDEVKEVTQEILDEIHSPLMRSSVYQTNTYYSLDKFTVDDMSNQDILLNAFLDIYEGNIKESNYNSKYSNLNREFDAKYIELRIKNIINRNIKYTLEDFSVPPNDKTKYVGNWKYSNNVFYYDGESKSTNSTVKYYDVESLIDAKYNNDDIIVTYYVGFVKETDNSYIIYSDPLMTNVIGSGTGENYKSTFENLDNSLKRKYQYTYKNNLCTYDEYCLYEGKWLDV